MPLGVNRGGSTPRVDVEEEGWMVAPAVLTGLELYPAPNQRFGLIDGHSTRGFVVPNALTAARGRGRIYPLDLG